MKNETVTVTTRACMFCGEASYVRLTPAQAERIDSGDPVQDVLPDMDRALRELLISGTHPACWSAGIELLNI